MLFSWIRKLYTVAGPFTYNWFKIQCDPDRNPIIFFKMWKLENLKCALKFKVPKNVWDTFEEEPHGKTLQHGIKI